MDASKRTNIIIPSSKIVPIEMQNEFGPIPPVLVPIMGKITIKKIMESYNSRCSSAFTGIQEGADLVESYFKFFPDDDIKLIRISPAKTLSDAIEKILQSVPSITNNPIVLNFADTIVRDLGSELIGNDFISFARMNETERWTLFKENHGVITDIADKKYLFDETPWKTFVGVWGFKNSKEFLRLIEEENQQNKSKAFYKAISRYSEKHPMILHETSNWIDIGHVDNYFSARKHIINTRFFNQIRLNDSNGTMIKTSMNSLKLRNEINWYITVPKELKYYTPTIFEYSLDYTSPFVEMEFYSYPSLDDCFVYSKNDLDTWEKIFSKIFSIIKVASKYTFNDENVRLDLESMYCIKTIERIEKFSKENPDLFKDSLNLKTNGKKLISLKEVITTLPRLINEFRLYNTNSLQIIHGDLCFSNILYDSKHGIIKIIDPRGQFGRHAIYGDIYYDLAKLSHSVLGLYDLIMFEQFKILKNADNNETNILWWNSPNQTVVGRIFEKHLKRAGFDLNKTRFIEALLFLSMLPLHKDHPNRQQAMLIRGLDILTGLVNNEKKD